MHRTGLVGVFFLAYLGVAVACLRQWGQPDPWTRIDWFSGGYLAAIPLWLWEYLVFLRGIGIEVLWGEVALLAVYAAVIFLAATRKLKQKIA